MFKIDLDKLISITEKLSPEHRETWILTVRYAKKLSEFLVLMQQQDPQGSYVLPLALIEMLVIGSRHKNKQEVLDMVSLCWDNGVLRTLGVGEIADQVHEVRKRTQAEETEKVKEDETIIH